MGRTQRLAQPEDFGKYQLIARLAHGRMGDVYKAKSHGVEGFEKILVVKIFHPALGAVPQFVDTLIEEAKRAVSLAHANVAQVIDLGLEEKQGRYYVALEHVNGFDLARAMNVARAANRPLSQELALFIASEIAKGLDYAHRRKDFNFNNLNIVHRALSPQNVMLSFDGEVKITDFGITRAIEHIEAIDDDDVIRRVLYAAPEVARGEPHTRQSDIFSLGLIFYEMLTGVHPYIGAPAEAPVRMPAEVVVARAQAAQIKPAGELVDLPRPLLKVLESMLVPNPAGRASSAGTLYEELVAFIFGNNLKADNRMLSVTMQELRRYEQQHARDASTLEVGLEEISLQELQQVFDDDEGYFAPAASGAEGGLPEATKSALPSARLARMFQGADSPDARPALPGALEDYFGSTCAGRGKAVLLSGRMGSGRHYLPDRLVDTLGRRDNARAIAIQTTVDDRLRPFGVLSDLILRCLHQTVSETLDHRQSALQALAGLRVPQVGIDTLAGLWNMGPAPKLGYEERRRELSGLLITLLRDLSYQGPLVLVIDQVERVDGLSLDVLRDVVAGIGRMPVMLVMATDADETMRAAFDMGRPEDLEAVRVAGQAPPPLDALGQLDGVLEELLILLALSEQPMSQADLGMLLGLPGDTLVDNLRRLSEMGVIRSPRPGMFYTGLPNVAVWLEDNVARSTVERLASMMVRYYTHRVVRGELDRLTPTLIRLNAYAGDRRRMLGLLEAYARWLERGGWHHTLLEFHKQCARLLSLEALGAPHVRIDCLLGAAEGALELAMLDECRVILQPLGALTEAVRNERGMVRSKLLMGQMAMQNDDLDEARTCFGRAVAAARTMRDPDLLARAMLALAGWHERIGDRVAAQQTLEGAMNLYTRWGTRRMDLGSRALMLHRAVRMWADRGQFTRAERPLADLRQIAEGSGIAAIECRADWAEARLRACAGRHDEALALFARATETAQRFGLVALHIELMREQAAACLEAGAYDDAIAIASQLVGHAAAHGDYYSEQRARDVRATACCLVGREIEAGLAHLEQSLGRARDRGVTKDVFRCHQLLDRALTALGRPADAAHHRQAAETIARTMRYWNLTAA